MASTDSQIRGLDGAYLRFHLRQNITALVDYCAGQQKGAGAMSIGKRIFNKQCTSDTRLLGEFLAIHAARLPEVSMYRRVSKWITLRSAVDTARRLATLACTCQSTPHEVAFRDWQSQRTCHADVRRRQLWNGKRLGEEYRRSVV